MFPLAEKGGSIGPPALTPGIMEEEIRVLFLSANSMEAGLNLAREYRKVSLALQRSNYREQVNIRHWPDAHLQDIPGELRRYKPNIVHFSGHAQNGQLILLDQYNTPRTMKGRTIVDLLTRGAKTVKLVVLNACHSHALALALVKEIACVVGTADAISDEGAAQFAESFYETLWNGGSVSDAFHDASAVVSGESPGEEGMFILLTAKGSDAGALRLVGPRGGT